jgi:transketolase
MPTTDKDSAQLTINTIRTLSMDAVEAAASGHPGTPMALAPVAYQLWTETLRYDPTAPLWPNRDRYILSCGHASMLLYSMIHLAGVKRPDGEPALPLEEIKNFRQWGSLTPGHPEHGHTYGVETTTGPLGQGCGNSVGFAIAQQWLASHFNRPGFDLFDYNTYVICSDGDLMEGVAMEAASLAGHLKLSNLCWIYDDNKITIEGETKLTFSEDVATKFKGMGWTVHRVEDANDLDALGKAYQAFADTNDAPTMIIVRSHIGYGAPNAQDTHGAHGAPLGEEEIRLAKQFYGWPEDAKFLVPEEVPAHFQENLGKRGAAARKEWEAKFTEYGEKHPELARQWRQMQAGELPEGWDAELPTFDADPKGMASRKSSGKVLNAVAKRVPWLLGGSADLAPSTNTLLDGEEGFQPDHHAGRNFHFGIREHGMAATVNGMALSHLRPYGATFFVFSDYLRPSMRLASLMRVPSIFIFTHDSIGVGEDGPTHQPIEHLSAARAIPGLVVLRPADANEVTEAWRTIMQFKDQAVALVLTRQNLPTIDRDQYAPARGVAQGAYILAEAEGGQPDVILIGTGSEVSICLAAREQLAAEGVKARVVSMPSWELFNAQSDEYREKVLPSNVTARVAVEAGIRQGWDRYIGMGGRFVGTDRFGASAPGAVVFRELGFTPENVAEQARALLKERS